MRHPLLLAGLCLGVFVLTSPVGADTLLLDTVDQARASASVHPTRGMTMQEVEARFGQPAQRRAAVGSPPITRWEYADFIVYFEYRHVIHAVHKRG